MTVTWVLEKNVFSEKCFDSMITHFKGNDIPYHAVTIVPFAHTVDGKVPQISGPVVAYGSLGIHKLVENQGWVPGVWGDRDSFSETNLINAIGMDALNFDATRCKFKDVLKYAPWDIFFVKPDSDTKDFAGMVTTKEEFNEWYMKMMTAGYFFEGIEERNVIMSPPKVLGCEWRLVILEKKVIEYSIYRQYQKVMPKHECPPEVIAFAESVAEKYSPADVYVMDVCETSEGYKVVEYNNFNSAGLYHCDVSVIIDKINKYVEYFHG